MNRENVLKVADAIESHSIPDLGFNMDQWVGVDGKFADRSGHNCGTTACIAGWAAAVAANLQSAPTGPMDFGIDDPEGFPLPAVRIARDFLGLSSEALFFSPRSFITPTQAVAVLRHLADTDEVDWSVADKVAA